MVSGKRTVLITGCSEGGVGETLAIAFQAAGLHVIATARNPKKMQSLASAGIDTMTLDIQSKGSIKACVEKLDRLDILVNNAGAGYNQPTADVDIDEAKNLYDLNVWSQVAMIQACIPLLIKSSNGVIVNHTSSASIFPVPFQPIYNSSKAAFAMFSDTMRLELAPFNIRVVELKTGMVKTKFIDNLKENTKPSLRQGSIYEPAREQAETIMSTEFANGNGTPAEVWSKGVVSDVLKANPPRVVYRGDSAWIARFLPMLPHGALDGVLKNTIGFDKVEKLLKKAKRT